MYRLTTETVAEGGVEVYAKSFGYDPVGNRLQQSTTGAGTGSVVYTYDERDRLLDEGGQVYSWEVDGNLTGKAAEATYAWNVEDRLETVTSADGTVVAHVYDADGVRVRTEVTPPGGSVEVTNYLVDTSRCLSFVVAGTDGSGNLVSYYVRGDDLLAVVRGIDVRYYHADGLGSIRALTDEAGTVTDRYSFQAFGNLLSHEGQDPNGDLDDLCSPRRTTMYLHGGDWHHTHGCIKVSNSDFSWLIDNVVEKGVRGHADLRVEYPAGSGFHR